MRIHTIMQSGILSATLLSALSAAGSPTHNRAAERPTLREMTVTTFDFRFEAPDTAPAGLTRIRLRNEGRDFHHVQLVRLGDRTTIPALLAAIAKPTSPLPAGTRFVGGPNVPPNGRTSEATLTLEPGRYAFLCFVAGEDHISHMNKGMTRLLTVVPTLETSSAHPNHAEPNADARMVLRDYAFDITPVIRAGRRTIRVETATDQPHEAVLGRLAPGKTLGDLMQWMAKREGPMPGEQIGGVTLLSRGDVNYFTADFPPGEYILLCFARDANDGKPHLAHGMARQFTVQADAPTTTSSQYSWSGVFDVVGSGFPEGDRNAVMEIARSDTSYALVSMQGGPGKLLSFTIARDSAHVMWHLGTDVLALDIRVVGDSVSGMWSNSEGSGPVRGARRR